MTRLPSSNAVTVHRITICEPVLGCTVPVIGQGRGQGSPLTIRVRRDYEIAAYPISCVLSARTDYIPRRESLS